MHSTFVKAYMYTTYFNEANTSKFVALVLTTAY